jgi:hypothetical protein
VLKPTNAAPGFGSSQRLGCGLDIVVPVGTNDVHVAGTFRLAAHGRNECQTVRFRTP